MIIIKIIGLDQKCPEFSCQDPSFKKLRCTNPCLCWKCIVFALCHSNTGAAKFNIPSQSIFVFTAEIYEIV